MKCKIEINLDNKAFDNPGELPRILRHLAELDLSFIVARHRRKRSLYFVESAPVFDINNNQVGSFTIEN